MQPRPRTRHVPPRNRFDEPCPAGLRHPHMRPKRKYKTPIEAIGQLAINRSRGRSECDWYICESCGWVHLSSQHRSTIGLVWTGKEIKRVAS